jgi:hypothetical protein
MDGHGSRFELEFLEYINNKATKWNVCIGVLYGTAYWQVGDSSEQNGCFKMALMRYKRELLQKKESVNEEFAIQKEGITYLVAQGWEDLFARAANNRKAIAERGWGPLNYNWLLHPELAATRHTSTTPHHHKQVQQESGLENQEEQGVHILTQLILTHGLAGLLIDSIVETRLRDEARNGINREKIRQKKIATAKEVIVAKKKRYTAGMHAAAEQFLLGTDVSTNQKERQRLLDLKLSEGEEKSNKCSALSTARFLQSED